MTLNNINKIGVGIIIMDESLQDNRTVTQVRDELAKAIVEGASIITRVILRELEEAIKKQNIFIQIGMKLGGKRLQDQMAPYIGAVFFLSFIGEEVNGENVGKVLSGLDVEPNSRFLGFVRDIDLSNNVIAYGPVILFLKLNRNEVNVSNMISVVNAMGYKADPATAKHVLEIYEEYANPNSERDENLPEYEVKLMRSTDEAAKMEAMLMTWELDRTLEHNDIDRYIRRGFVPYLTAIGVLVYSGEEISAIGEERFLKYDADMVKAIGIEPDSEMKEFVRSMNYQDSAAFHCIPAIYLLLSLGMEVNVESVKKLLDSVGLNMSIELVGFAYTFYTDHKDIIRN